MSLLKYVNEQGEEHGSELSWPGLFGLPVRGRPGLMKQDELEDSFETAYDFHCKEFDLSDEVQRTEYTQIKDRICNGWYREVFCERHRDKDTGHLIAYLEWCQTYGHIAARRA
jgi:hypothetical protein